MRIIVDLDSIAADFFKVLLEDHNAATGEGLEVSDITSWNMKECTRFPAEIYKPFMAPGFFARLPLMPGAAEALKALVDDGHEVVIATAPATPHAAAEKVAWCAQHLPFLDQKNVWIGHKKHHLQGDVLIDDGPHNALAFRQAHPNAFIATIGYAYNDVPEFNLRVGSYETAREAWQTILAVLRTRAQIGCDTLRDVPG